MAYGLYTVVAGGLAQERCLEVLAPNLANVSTVGFKAEVPFLRSYPQTPPRPPGSVPFSMKVEGDGHHCQSPRHSALAYPIPASMVLWCARTTNTSPAAMALLTEDYAAAPTDGARMRWRKKSTPARP
jgi:Flagella basal body rod protein